MAHANLGVAWGATAFLNALSEDYTFNETVDDSVDIIVTTVSPNTSSPAMAITATSASNNANSTSD